MTAFGKQLRALLAEERIAQAELARRLHVTAQAVSTWVTGNTIPTRENVEAIEAQLDVRPRGSLVRAAGYSTDGSAEQPTVESLIRADPGIEDEDKRLILRVILLARERYGRSRQTVSTANDFEVMEKMADANRRRRVRSG